MRRVRLVWIEVGMALAVVAYLGIALFLRDADLAGVPLMLWYMAALVFWAGYAEVATVIAERNGVAASPPVRIQAAEEVGRWP